MSLSSTGSFLRRPGIFKSFHRKKKSTDSAGATTKVDAASTAHVWKERAEQPREVADEKEILVQQESDETSAPRKSEETMKEIVRTEVMPRGLPNYSPDMALEQGLIDKDNLKAFGITMDDNVAGKKSMGKRDKTKGNSRATTTMTTLSNEVRPSDVFEMDVPTSAAKERRPDLQVSIPSSKTSPPKGSRVAKVSGVHTPYSAVSPPSTSVTNKSGKMMNGAATSQVSIVSPLSAIEMIEIPKNMIVPTRPMDEGPHDGKAEDKPIQAMKSANSMSTNGTSEQGENSSELSERSSMSSVNSMGAMTPEEEEDRPVIVDATSMRFDTTMLYHAALVPQISKFSKTALSPQGSLSRPAVRRQNSSTSLRSNSTINVNKPLPPEPPRSSTSPLTNHSSPSAGHSQTPSRSSSVTIRQRALSQDSGRDSVSALPAGSTRIDRCGSKGSASKLSLRSKYTPKDLDAMDDAFQRKINAANQKVYSNQSTPSHSQVSLLPEPQQLDTINEDSPRGSRISSANDPLQISRGPMRMEPSRRAPQPPQSQLPHRASSLTAAEKTDQRKRFMKRSHSSNHIGSQIKSDAAPHRRLSAQGAGSNNKANRILGKPCSQSPGLKESPILVEPKWTRTDSPRDFSRSTSPGSVRDESNMPELEAPKPDVHVEEIRKRLELLSPKDDPSVTFLAFHQKNASMEKIHIEEEEQQQTQQDPPKIQILPNTPQVEVAELEALQRSPSPVELDGTTVIAPVEMGLPSPLPVAVIPIPPEPTSSVSERRGRKNTSNPHSMASGKCRSLHSQRSLKARSLASLAASEIPDIYATLPTPPNNNSLRPSMTAEEVEQLISADAAERVLLRILESLDNLADLFAAALVSRGFYRTFKRNELHLLKRAIYRMSPAAWELREMSLPYQELEMGAKDYTPNLYFRHYVQDLLTMVELKAMILESCKSFLRQETISGLAGETDRSPLIDEAFWRVWTFCRIFGCGNNREDDIVGQMDWLKGGPIANSSTDTRTLALTDELARNSVLFNPPMGFAKGNGKGLTAEELYDMTEIWTCLGVLVRGYQGKRKEAREYGIFENATISQGDAAKESTMIGKPWGWRTSRLLLTRSRGMDVPPSHPRTSCSSRRHIAHDADPSNIRPRQSRRLHQLDTPRARSLQINLPERSRLPRVRRGNGRLASSHHAFTKVILRPPQSREPVFHGLTRLARSHLGIQAAGRGARRRAARQEARPHVQERARLVGAADEQLQGRARPARGAQHLGRGAAHAQAARARRSALPPHAKGDRDLAREPEVLAPHPVRRPTSHAADAGSPGRGLLSLRSRLCTAKWTSTARLPGA